MAEQDNTLAQLLEKTTLLYNSALSNYELVRDAILTDDDIITVNTTNLTGDVEVLELPSFKYISRQIERLSSQVAGLTDFSQGETYAELIDVSGKIRALYSVSYDQRPARIVNTQDVILSEDSTLNDGSDPLAEIFSPWVKTKIDLTNKVKVNVNATTVKRYKLSQEVWERFNSDESIDLDAMNDTQFEAWLLDNATTSDYTKLNKDYPLEFSQVRYYGTFGVMSLTLNETDSDKITTRLSTIRFNDKDSKSALSRQLVVGDRLVSPDGSTVFEVLSVQVSTNTVDLQRVVGHAQIATNDDALIYLDQFQPKYLNLPIFFNERSVVFIAAVDSWWLTSGDYSTPILVDSSAIYVIDETNTRLTIDEFYTRENGQDIGKFIKQLAFESNPPADIASKPNAPILTEDLFEVGVVNEHIINNSDTKQIKKLYSNKKAVKKELDKRQSELFTIRKKLDYGQYKNALERKTYESKAQNISKSVESRLTEFKTLVTSLSENDGVKFASRTYRPKYNVQAFWSEPQPSENDSFTSQIVQYIVHYRYLAKTGEVSKSKSKTIMDNGTEKTGTFSAWNEYKSPIRTKQINSDGVITYTSNDIGDSDAININQVSLPIQTGEDMEVRIKAISNIGQPFVSVESDWSNIVKVEFPDSLDSTQDLSTLELELQKDLRQIEYQQNLDNIGVIQHISDSFYERQKYFAHTSNRIASGFFTAEQNNIPLFDYLVSLTSDVNELKSAIFNVKGLIDITLLSSEGDVYKLHNNGITEIFAGYYTDATETTLGDIITKNFYLNINNSGTTLTTIYSLLPGDPSLDFQTKNVDNQSWFNAPVGFITSDDDNKVLPLGGAQNNNMISYVRSRNVNNNGDLYDTNSWTATIKTDWTGLSGVTIEASGDYIHRTVGGDLERLSFDSLDATIKTELDLIAFSITHPTVANYIANPTVDTTQEVNDLFDSLTLLPPHINTDNIQNGFPSGDSRTTSETSKVLYDIDDKYMVGAKSVGAMVSMSANSKDLLQVTQNLAYAGKELQAGETNALNIPIVFQYRMTDYTNTPRGFNVSGSTSVRNYKISKIIGVDILILGQKHSYDLKFTAEYKPKSLSSKNTPWLNKVDYLSV